MAELLLTREGAGPAGLWAARGLGRAAIKQAGSIDQVLNPYPRSKAGCPRLSRDLGEPNGTPGSAYHQGHLLEAELWRLLAVSAVGARRNGFAAELPL